MLSVSLFLLMTTALQIRLSLDPVVMLQHKGLDQGGQLHVEIEEVDREGHDEEAEGQGEQPQKQFFQQF